jgi:hypothetical protein
MLADLQDDVPPGQVAEGRDAAAVEVRVLGAR